MSQSSVSTVTKQALKETRMWKVVLHNDDYTPMDFVIELLCGIFNKNRAEAESLTMHVHESGLANVGLYTKEIALWKVQIALDFAEQYQHPLRVTAEEA